MAESGNCMEEVEGQRFFMTNAYFAPADVPDREKVLISLIPPATMTAAHWRRLTGWRVGATLAWGKRGLKFLSADERHSKRQSSDKAQALTE